MRRYTSLAIAGIMLLTVIITPLLADNAMGLNPDNNSVDEATPVFLNVYTSPRYPLGASNWTTGEGGDVITVYAEVSDANTTDPGVYINWAFCNNQGTCYQWAVPDWAADPWFNMNHVAGNLYNFTLPGDPKFGTDVYEACASNLCHVMYQILAYSEDWNFAAAYPGPTLTPYPDLDEHIELYPAFPPTQINATSALSKSTMWTDQTFWVNGTSNYWNSTSYPGNYSELLPADECNVIVKVGTAPFYGKTDIWGNYSVQVMAPPAAGQYTVNTTVSNATANRNVPCKALEHQIQVNAHWMNLSMVLNTTTTLPSQPLWANGTVKLDGATVPAGYPVNISIESGEYNLTNTLAGGTYAAKISAPDVTGTFTVNATVQNATYSIAAWNQTDITVVAVPVPDLVIANANVKVSGNLVQGQSLKLNATVFNMGLATATEAMINITLDNALLNSSKRTIAVGANTTISLNWVAVPGIHYLNASADPMNTTEESSETNNKAGIVFTVMADNDGDGIGDPTDPDDDNDGVNDTDDAFPFDSAEWLDTDGDGTGNNADTDDDGDGVPDAQDDLPLNPNETVDTDGDGTGNNADTDDDGDGVPDASDAFPLDPTERADFDGDGIGDKADTDDDSDGIPDNSDPFPWDTDNDGLMNTLDSDDDADGIPDSQDLFPLDTDNDGLNNAADTDDDGDGTPDTEDAFPLNGTETVDTDGDGIGNNADPDDDDDGVPDADDPDPLDPTVTGAGGGIGMGLAAGIVITVIIVIVILAYVFVIRPKQQ